MKNLIPESDEEMLEKFIIKHNFSKSYPYFYKIIDTKHNPNKIFYILIRSIDDISNIKKKYFLNPKMFPYDAEFILKPYWKGKYNKEEINSYDFIEFDNLENDKKIIVPFEKKSCIVEVRKTVLKINKEGNKEGEEDFFTYKVGNNYFLEGFSSDKLNIKFYKELMFFNSNNIGNRILVISEKLNNNKYYGIIDGNNSFFIPLNYENYVVKEDYIYLYSYPKLKLIKNKDGFDYYVVEKNNNENDIKITKFDINLQSIENQHTIDLFDFNSTNRPSNIYISEINDPSIQNLIKYIVASKNEIKIFTFFTILRKIKKENLKFKYDKNLFDFVDIIISIEPKLIEGAFGVKKKSCYLATHIYQDINHPNVEYFRSYRDNVLINYFLGRIFIKYYYKYSPSLVRKLKNKKVLNNVIKTLLDMIIVFIK